jgi:hypothetical protein
MSSNHSSPTLAPPSRAPELIARRHASLSAEYTHLAAPSNIAAASKKDATIAQGHDRMDKATQHHRHARRVVDLVHAQRPGSLPVTAAVLQGVSGVQEPRTVVEAHIHVRLALASSNECWYPGALDVDTAYDGLG